MPADFVDTNILVYAYDRTAGSKFERARGLMEKLWDRGDGVISTQVLEEFYVTITGKIPSPLAPRPAREIVSDLSTWRVTLLEVSDILKASEVGERYRLSFWDALILTSAQKEGVETLWSEDLRHGQEYDGVTVRNPFAP